MMGLYDGTTHGVGFQGTWFYRLGAVGVVSGVVIFIGAAMLYTKPAQTPAWGTLILVFAVASLLGRSGSSSGWSWASSDVCL